MNCMMNFYFCGRQPREWNENPLICEVVVVEPKIPYQENLNFTVDSTVTKHDECLYGQERDMPFDDIFLSPFHNYYFFNMTNRTFNAYQWGNNLGADMLELIDYMYDPNAIRRITFKQFKDSWRGGCPCKPIPALCTTQTGLFDYGILPSPDSVGYTTTDIFDFHAKTMPTNEESYIWCEIRGVRSPKMRPLTAITKYLFRPDQTSLEGDSIVKSHLSLLPTPKLHVVCGTGIFDGWIHLSCTGVPHAAFLQKESAISLVFQRGGSDYDSVLAVHKVNTMAPNETYIDYSCSKWGKNAGGPSIDYAISTLPLVNDILMKSTPLSNDRQQVGFMLGSEKLINVENGEDLLPVYVNRSLMLYYDSVKCSYAYQGHVSEEFMSTNDLVSEANAKCLPSEYEMNIIIGSNHFFSCQVNYKVTHVEGDEIVKSTCKMPIVHLYSREIYSNRLMPFEVTCTHPNAVIHSRAWVLQSGVDGSSQNYVQAGDSYCIYGDHMVEAIITLLDSYSNYQVDTLEYYCSFSEQHNYISKSTGPVSVSDYNPDR